MAEASKRNETDFTTKQVFALCIIIALDFTITLNLNIVNPLGFQLIKQLSLSTERLGWLVSTYALSTVLSGIGAIGFVDKVDRKKLMLITYSGFLAGLLFGCLTDSYEFLMASRIMTGVFGGMSFATGIALTTDLFPISTRGKALSYKRLSFPIYQLAGIPLVIWLSENNWKVPFRLLLILTFTILLCIKYVLPNPELGLKIRADKADWRHWAAILTSRKFLPAYGFTFLFAAGAFMLDPYFTTFLTENLSLPVSQLPLVFTITGVVSVITTPIIAYLSDKIDVYKLLFFSSLTLIFFIIYFTNLEHASFSAIVVLICIGYVSVAMRGVAAGVLITSLPTPDERASFANICNALEQVGGAAAAYLGSIILIQNVNRRLENFDTSGYFVCVAIGLTIILMYFSNEYFKKIRSNPG